MFFPYGLIIFNLSFVSVSRLPPKSFRLHHHMNRPSLSTLLILSLALAAPAFLTAEDVTLMNGKILKNAKIMRVDPDGIRFLHDAGITKALVEELPVEIKTKHNFDMAKATAFREQSTKEQAEMANKSMERKQALEDARVAEALRKKEEMDKTPRLTVSQSVKGLWLRSLPWPKGLERDQLSRRKFCEYMTQQINGGAFDLEAESTALKWNIQEQIRVGASDSARLLNDQLVAVIAQITERDAARQEAELKERELAIQAAGVAATQDIALALNNIAFQMLLGAPVIVTFW
jgi:hypothetical protein